MTLNEFIDKYNGQFVRGGQCGELVRQYWIDVDQTNPPSYANSKDYWSNPVPGYDKVSTPQPGNIAIYDGHAGFPEGHSAIYLGNGQVFEQNADPDGSPAHVFTRANTYLLGYLHKQGASMEVMTKDAAYKVVTYLYNLGTGAPPTPDQGEYWATRMTTVLTAIDELGQAMEKQLAARMNTSYIPYTGATLYVPKS